MRRCSRVRLRLQLERRRWIVGDMHRLGQSMRRCSSNRDVQCRCGRLGRSGVVGMGEGIVGVASVQFVVVYVQMHIEGHGMDMGIDHGMVVANMVMCNRG